MPQRRLSLIFYAIFHYGISQCFYKGDKLPRNFVPSSPKKPFLPRWIPTSKNTSKRLSKRCAQQIFRKRNSSVAFVLDMADIALQTGFLSRQVYALMKLAKTNEGREQ